MVPDDLTVDTTARIELCVVWAMVEKTRPLKVYSLPEVGLVGGGKGDVVPDDPPVEAVGKTTLPCTRRHASNCVPYKGAAYWKYGL